MPTLSIWEIRVSGSQNIPIKQLKCHLLLAEAKWANRRWRSCRGALVLRAHCVFLSALWPALRYNSLQCFVILKSVYWLQTDKDCVKMPVSSCFSFLEQMTSWRSATIQSTLQKVVFFSRQPSQANGSPLRKIPSKILAALTSPPWTLHNLSIQMETFEST